MNWRLLISDKVDEEIERISDKDIQQEILDNLHDIEVEP